MVVPVFLAQVAEFLSEFLAQVAQLLSEFLSHPAELLSEFLPRLFAVLYQKVNFALHLALAVQDTAYQGNQGQH